jgi:ABC-2 type transport system ATP-binding protein
MRAPIAKLPTSDLAVISTDNLSRSFDKIEAVKHLTLTVKRGEIFGFLGPNGAGKSTTIKMLCGLVAPTSGKGSVCDLDIGTQRDAIKRATGYMAQHFSLYPDLTAEENLRFFAGVYGIRGAAATARMTELFTRVGVVDKRRELAGRLSGGLKQRLALACALVHKPKLVFLDEPTAGVDPAQRQKLWDLLYDLCQEGMSLFVTTHYLDEAERCHTVGFMLGGELIDVGAPLDLRQKLRGKLIGVRTREATIAMRALRALPFVSDVTIYGHELRLFTKRPTEARTVETEIRRALAAAGAAVLSVYPLEPTLEDLFMAYDHNGASLGSDVQAEAV